MAYYKIPSQVPAGWDYVVPYESYRELLTRNPITLSVTVGNQATANEILARNQAACIDRERDRFHVYRLEIWRTREYRTPCDLDTEPNSDDMTYGVYDVIANETVYVVGLSAALDERKQSQDKFLANINMGSYEILTFIPID